MLRAPPPRAALGSRAALVLRRGLIQGRLALRRVRPAMCGIHGDMLLMLCWIIVRDDRTGSTSANIVWGLGACLLKSVWGEVLNARRGVRSCGVWNHMGWGAGTVVW